jgi:hypothetical protein
MSGVSLSAKIHKWLALFMAIQILFWFVSGLFSDVFPIERVRSEQAVAEQPGATPDASTLRDSAPLR